MAKLNLINKKKLKDYINSVDNQGSNMRCSSSYLENLNNKLKDKVDRHINRAILNNRNTVQDKDL